MNKELVRIEKWKTWTVVPVFLIISMSLGCAHRAVLGPVYLYPKVEPVDIELKSFSFQPNHIAILRDQLPFIFRLKNTALIKHNFTLIDSQKNTLINVDLMPDEPAVVTIEPLEPGNYTFYCNRFLHRRGGMEGMFMVAE